MEFKEAAQLKKVSARSLNNTYDTINSDYWKVGSKFLPFIVLIP